MTGAATRAMAPQSMKYVILGDPSPLARSRLGNGRLWESQKELKRKWGIMLAHGHNGNPLFTGPLHLDVVFYFEIPKSLPEKKRKELNETLHYARPHSANLIKFISDIGIDILYHDDCLI